MMDLFSGLNAQQCQAVQHIDGPLLVFAGAGSGKTRVIVHRVANLIQSGVSPSEILCLTFTNKAAGEMKERLLRMLGPGQSGIWAGTFHSFGAWMLRREAVRLGYPPSFAIYDAADQRTLVGRCLKELHIKTERSMDSNVAWLIGMCKDTLQDYRQVKSSLKIDAGPVMRLYEERKQAGAAFDFGDLIKVPGELLAHDEEVRQRYRGRFRYLLVDEYQDTNMAQYVMLMGLVGEGRNICVVGDDDQSIYGWRGADVGNILRFEQDFPKAQVVKLELNYRSTAGILTAASNLIAHNRRRASKTLRPVNPGEEEISIREYPDDDHEAAATAHAIGRLLDQGVAPGGIGVFYRINALSRVIEENFVRRGIPYAVFGGMRFYERREIKDVLGYLRVLVNNRDEEALARIINTPARGIGPKTLALLQEYARSTGQPTFTALRAALGRGIIKGAGLKGLQAFLAQMQALQEMLDGDVGRLMEAVLEITGLEEELLRDVDGEDRLTNIRELIASAAGQQDLVHYLEEKALIAAMDVEPGEKVSTMTLHMSKGLEFDHVFILGLEEGLLPHGRAIGNTSEMEEERRLLYVGITRARKQAYLSWARVRALYGRESFQYPSGFLAEIQRPL